MQLKHVGFVCAAALAFSVAVGGAPAQADWGTGGNDPSSGGSSCSFGAATADSQTVVSNIQCSDTVVDGSGRPISTGDWTPPKCWWEPEYTATQFLAFYGRMMMLFKDTGEDNDDPQARQSFVDAYSKQLGNDGSTGSWYDYVCQDVDDYPANFPGPDGFPWLWVPNGSTTAAGDPVLSMETLEQIATANLRVPDLTLNMSPAPTLQTVNEQTWFSVSRSSDRTQNLVPQSSTAALPAFNMSATVTATPTDLQISVTGPDAETNPTSLTCPINADGTVGDPIGTTGAGSSDCSLTFLHATTSAPDSLVGSVVWVVTLNGGGGAGWPKRIPVSTQPIPITVNEVQTVNNG